MKRRTAVLTLVLLATLGVAVSMADGLKNLGARLSGYQEVPALSTTGTATFLAKINQDETEIDWQLSYADLESPVTQSHIHFNAPGLNGPVVVFFCTNLGNGPAGTPLCPEAPATIEGTITAADVLAGAAAVGLEAGNLAELIDALRAGATYANVHTQLRAGGEVRGQITVAGNGHHGH